MRERTKAYFDSLDDRELVRLLREAGINLANRDFYLFLRENDWERLRKFEFKASLNTWLTVVAVRFFQKKKISQTKLVAIDPQLIVETKKNEADDYDIIHEMSRLELYQAIDRLSKPRERYALLADLAGKRADDIAEEMGCTVAAVYNLTKKARLELKSIMQERKEA